MRYLWDTPHSLDGNLFHRLLPDFRATPVDQALSQAIAHIELRRSNSGLKSHPLNV